MTWLGGTWPHMVVNEAMSARRTQGMYKGRRQ